MPGVKVDVGTGSKIAFTTSAYAANLLSLEYSGPSVGTPDSSHMGTADSSPAAGEFSNRTFISGNLIDGGELCELLKELSLGTRTEMVEEVTIDPEWFSTI